MLQGQAAAAPRTFGVRMLAAMARCAIGFETHFTMQLLIEKGPHIPGDGLSRCSKLDRHNDSIASWRRERRVGMSGQAVPNVTELPCCALR